VRIQIEIRIREFDMATLSHEELPITIDPEIVSGTPVFRGTRVPIQTLFDYLADGYTLDEILEYFPTIQRQDAVRVLEIAPHFLAGAVAS
jgi:uncharacterized protein (DUF433 family)